MADPIPTQTALAAEVEQICGTLFERWCDRRSVIPLACLMRNWPIVSCSPPRIRQLSSSLRQLADSDHDSLDTDDRRLIHSMVTIASHLA
jgi:hypothetical protein